MSQLIFIAIPTSGCVKDGAITEKTLKFLAGLHKAYPEKTFICPMVQDYQLLKYLPPEFTPSWDTWQDKCTRLLEAADELWVPKFDGWLTSTGVQAEIKIAEALGKRIAYIIVRRD